MKKFILFFLVLLFCLFFVSFLAAQELKIEESEDVAEIEFELDETETEEKSITPFFDFLEKNFSGSVAAAQASGEYGKRDFYLWQLKYNQEITDWLKVFITGSGFHNKVLLKSTLKEECRIEREAAINGTNLNTKYYDCRDVTATTEETREFKITTFNTELREAYFDLDIGSFALLSAGRKLNAWGQFELFSPIDIFTLPRKYSNVGLSFSKLDEQISQNTLQLNFYTGDLVEFQFYYFPSIKIDTLFESIPDEFKQYRKPIKISEPQNRYPYGVEYEDQNYAPLEALDNSVQAARVLFYPSWGIIGLTYYKGFKDYPTVLGRLKEFTDPSIDGKTYRYIEEREAYTENNVFGIEMAIPVGRWTWKLEHARILNEKSFFPLLQTDDFSGEIRNNDSYYNNFQTEVENLADWIENENDGEANYDYQTAFTALGVEADLDRWKYNLVLWVFQTLYDAKAQEARRLETELEIARGGQPEDFPDTFAFPTFNITQYYNDKKTAFGGFAFGFLPQGVGLNLYFNFEFFESLKTVFAFEAIQYRGDFAIFDNIIGGDAYEIEGGGVSVGVRFGFLYQF